MSQPWHRGACCPLPGKLDSTLNEFWSENPWDIISQGHNLSAYERKRAFLNVRGRDFLDISALTGADGDGDGRCVVAGDFPTMASSTWCCDSREAARLSCMRISFRGDTT